MYLQNLASVARDNAAVVNFHKEIRAKILVRLHKVRVPGLFQSYLTLFCFRTQTKATVPPLAG